MKKCGKSTFQTKSLVRANKRTTLIQISHTNALIHHFFCNLATKFRVTTNVTNEEWNDDLYNKSSQAYQDLLAKLIAEVIILLKEKIGKTSRYNVDEANGVRTTPLIKRYVQYVHLSAV